MSIRKWSPSGASPSQKEKEGIAQRIFEAKQAADDAFWDAFAKHFPEVPSGDFPPQAETAWSDAATEAVFTWLITNHPEKRLIKRVQKDLEE
jgi:hypothetical protein